MATYEARAPRSRLETLSRCGSSLHGEPALEIVGGLAIGNPEGIAKVWADVALIAATHKPVTTEAIHALARVVIHDVVERMRFVAATKARKRWDVLTGIVFSELSLLARGGRHTDLAEHRAKAAKIRYQDYLVIERDAISVILDRIDSACGNIRRSA